MSSMLHAKARPLQEHRDVLRRERRMAQTVCERLKTARQFAMPAEAECLGGMIQQAERIERYFYEMDRHTDQMYTELGLLSQKIGNMLDNNRYWYDRFAK